VALVGQLVNAVQHPRSAPPCVGITAKQDQAAGLTAEACAELPPAVWALVQTIVHGESGDKQVEVPTPTSYREATEGYHAPEWLESMASELRGFQETGTYSEVPRPSGRNIVKSKWVYKVKRRREGTPQFKSRLVAKGFSQEARVDFVDTWAPTARQATARLMLHLAAALRLSRPCHGR